MSDLAFEISGSREKEMERVAARLASEIMSPMRAVRESLTKAGWSHHEAGVIIYYALLRAHAGWVSFMLHEELGPTVSAEELEEEVHDRISDVWFEIIGRYLKGKMGFI